MDDLVSNFYRDSSRPHKQDVNWTCVSHFENVYDVFRTSYVQCLFTSYAQGNKNLFGLNSKFLFKKMCIILMEETVMQTVFRKVSELQSWLLIKSEVHHDYFPGNFCSGRIWWILLPITIRYFKSTM